MSVNHGVKTTSPGPIVADGAGSIEIRGTVHDLGQGQLSDIEPTASFSEPIL